MSDHRGDDRAGADGDEGEQAAADELVHRLHGVHVQDGKQKAAEQADGDGAAVFDAGKHDAAQQRLFKKGGKQRHDEQYAEKARPFQGRKVGGGDGIAEALQQRRQPRVHPVEAEQGAEGEQQRQHRVARAEGAEAELFGAFFIYFHEGGDDCQKGRVADKV